MNKTGKILLAMSALFALCVIASFAQRMPQDNWYLKKTFGQAGSGDGQFNGAWGVAVGSNDNIFIADTGNHRIQVFDADGNFLFKWGSNGSGNQQFSSPRAIAIGTNGLVYVADQGNNRIQVFDQAGVFLRGWPCPSPVGVAINYQNRLVHVADGANKQVKVFVDDGTGTLVRAWGEPGLMPGKFENIRGIAVGLGGRCYVADKRAIQAFSAEGVFLNEALPNYFSTLSLVNFYCVIASRDGLVFACQDYHEIRSYFWDTFKFTVYDQDLNILKVIPLSLNAVGVAANGDVYLAGYDNSIRIMNRTFRIAQEPVFPLPCVVSVIQRAGTTYVDIDYEITDADSPTVAAGVLAFSGGTNSLNNLMRLNTFVEGTASNVGANISANIPHRITWNAAADWAVDYGSAKFRILACDGRGLLDHLFINMPADGTNPPLAIARDPVTQYDMLHCWYWLIATNDTAIGLVSGVVSGVGGSYNGVVLASDTTTTTEGRSFLFERMGLREATPAELARMRSGASGVVNQWTPRLQVGPGERPKAVNEWGFDTGDWGGDGWWVVKP